MHILRSRLLAEHAGVAHAFFTRAGGVSRGLYASLNCGLGSADDGARVRENLARAAAALDADPAGLITLRQVHGRQVVSLGAGAPLPASRPQADALVTDNPAGVLGITGADCPSVLLFEPLARVIGAAHAGWRGALGGVVEATVSAMRALGAVPARICACIGPGIQQASYEVDAEFRRAFVSAAREDAGLFATAPARGRYLFDLAGYVEGRLRAAGVHDVERIAVDTVAEEELLFSYRRSRLRNEPDYGRQLAAIRLC